MKELRHKDSSQENFPVGMLIRKELQSIVCQYYQVARLGDDIADDDKLSSAEKLTKLEKLEDVFLGIEKNPTPEFSIAQELGTIFKKENLATSLITDLLKAFKQDAQGFEYQSWEQLVSYCSFSAAPVGRFMLAIHNENPSTYFPATELCVALQIVNHIQDIKYDYELLGRIYLPNDYFQEFGVSKKDLQAKACSEELRSMINKCLEQVNGLLKDAKILLRITRSFRLRMEIGVILSLTNSMIKRIQRGDVLACEIKLSKFDWLKAFCVATKTALIK